MGFAPAGPATWKWGDGWKARPEFSARVLDAAAAALEELKMNPTAGYQAEE